MRVHGELSKYNWRDATLFDLVGQTVTEIKVIPNGYSEYAVLLFAVDQAGTRTVFDLGAELDKEYINLPYRVATIDEN